ncbi:MAG: hypothetical protein ACYDD2_13345 [Candidatus Acidiferrales bacterium]
MKKDYRVKFKVGDSEVEVEGAEVGVVKIVEALSEVLRGAGKEAKSSVDAVPLRAVAPATRTSPTDIRTFFAEKQPSSDVEAAAVAAYYYQYLADESSRQDTIDSATLKEAFRLAKRPLPARTIFTLQNARNAGYLDSGGEAGRFRLNSVGYNLVEHSLAGPQTGEPKRFPRTARRSARR